MDSTLTYSTKTAWAAVLKAVAAFFAIGMSIYSMILVANMPKDAGAMAVNASSGSQTGGLAATCLGLVGWVLSLTALVLIFQDSKRVGPGARHLAVAALVVFILEIVAMLAVSAFSIFGTLRGSVVMFRSGLWMGALNGILGFAVPVLLFISYYPRWGKVAWVVGAGLAALASLISVAMIAPTYTLQPLEMMGQTLFIPVAGIDVTQGLYPVLSNLVIGFHLLTAGLCAWLAVRAFREAKAVLPEGVA